MQNLLYIGNKLNKSSSNITTIDILGNLLIQEGYSVKFSSSISNKFIRLIDMLITVFVNRNNTDYVLIDTYSTLNFYYAVLVGRLCRILKLKYIPILHGGKLSERLEKSPKKSKLLFGKAYKCISPSKFLKFEFEQKGYTNIEYIPNTIEIVKYPFKNRQLKTPKLLWVRSFKEIYNPLMAIKVFKELKKIYKDASLCMVGPDGDGTYLKARKQARDLNLEVEFTGKLTKAQWINLSKEHNIFINTSFFDNMPVTLIEAMALGLPVVTTNVGGIPYMVKDKKEALLVKPDTVTDMVEAIKKLIHSHEKVQLLTSSARKKAEQFDWEIVKKDWFKILY